MIDTLRLTAEAAGAMLERGEVSADELHAAYRAAIDERDPGLHAYLRTVDEVEGDGVPIAFKDLISTKGVETTAGSKILAGYRPVYDATVAARCRRAGLGLLGKRPSRRPWPPRGSSRRKRVTSISGARSSSSGWPTKR